MRVNLESVTPECLYQGSIVFKNQRKSKNVDSRLKISGMTDDVDASLNFGHDRGERDCHRAIRGEKIPPYELPKSRKDKRIKTIGGKNLHQYRGKGLLINPQKTTKIKGCWWGIITSGETIQ